MSAPIASTSKRRIGQPIGEPVAKKAFSIFTPVKDRKPCFKWLEATHTGSESCLQGAAHDAKLPKADSKHNIKLAMFDLDGTLIRPRGRSQFSGDETNWQWWHAAVPKKLKQVHAQGYTIIIFTNQLIKSNQLAVWKRKIPLVAQDLGIPFLIFAATQKDQHRKPLQGMWQVAISNIAPRPVYDASSYYVGDAAGRANDHSDGDRKFAYNLGLWTGTPLAFHTPEAFFLDQTELPFELSGFDPDAFLKETQDMPRVTPTSSALVPNGRVAEVVVAVGYPGSGKTQLYRDHFASKGYVHVNQDTLKTRIACISLVESSLREGKSCFVDNTNRNIETRAHYIDLCRQHNANVRCLNFDVPFAAAWHCNLFRAFVVPNSDRSLVPETGYTSFREAYQPPTTHEGFDEVLTVNLVPKLEGKNVQRWRMRLCQATSAERRALQALA
ncbi:hypothetical protein E5Q_02802 [Mixia osmundae IAM 14324]|uniref:PNK FHA domain-containing protein n=1 Tax=Mixia osmundae (strain CBS 9802 / IAM 14324 / JCM 22182 / KY 12970) TaxID=764103 RepID=G7DZY1_MIXOS|nr:hypothetical protein E5Q_02802 [Mixia osmundae IAM 14324]